MRRLLPVILTVLLFGGAMNVRAGGTPKYNKNDLQKLTEFLVQTNGSGTNLTKLHPSIVSDNLPTLTLEEWEWIGVTWMDLDMEWRLTELFWHNMGLVGKLDLTECNKLSWLSCDNNSLESLTIKGCTALQHLSCGKNGITSLDLSDGGSLLYLNCVGNALTSLDLSKCGKLEDLLCYSNRLTELDVTGLTELKWLFCYDNNLSSLDLSGCTMLQILYCSSNQLDFTDLKRIREDYLGLNIFLYYGQTFTAPQQYVTNNPISLKHLLATELNYTYKCLDGNDTEIEGASVSGGILNLPAGYTGKVQVQMWCDEWVEKEGGGSNVTNPTLTYTLTVRDYIVTFDSQGGSAVLPQQPAPVTRTITKPSDPRREGYVFGGWYTSTEYEHEWTFDWWGDKVRGDMTLYARWYDDIARATANEIDSEQETGSAICPEVTLTDPVTGKTLKRNWDYTVAYSDNVSAGRACITLTGTGTWRGTKRVYFTILGKSTFHYATIPFVAGITTNPAPGRHLYKEGHIITLEITAIEGNSLGDMTIRCNGELIYPSADAADLRSDETVTVKLPAIYEDLDLQIELYTVGIGDVASSFNVSGGRGAIRIETDRAGELRVIDLAGHVAANRHIDEGATSIAVRSGIYIVSLGEERRKVVVR